MKKIHPLLLEKLRAHFTDSDPRLKDFEPFFSDLDVTLEDLDSARKMLEESIQLTSSELINLNKEKQAKNLELSTLYKLATITQNVSSLDEVYGHILKEIVNATLFPVAFIGLTIEKSDHLEIIFWGGEDFKCESLKVQFDKTILSDVIATCKPLIKHRVMSLKSQDDFLRDLKIQTLLSVPMTVDGKVIGFLSVADVKDQGVIEPSLVKLTELLAGHVSTLIVRKQNEAKLKEVLKSLPDENPNPILRVSPEGVILYANQASDDILKSWKSSLGACLPKDLTTIVQDAIYKKCSAKLELKVEAKALVLLVFPREHYANLYITDITDLKNTEMLMRQQAAQMVVASKLATLGEMAGGIAHEINNPLAIIHANGNVLKDLMAEDFDKALGLKVTEKIIATTERIAKIIRGLKAISRNGDDDPFDTVTIEQIIDDATGICREKFKIHNVALEVENTAPHVNIECKKVQIIQVLLNFLNNAYDAIEDLPERWVKIGIKDEREDIEISVTDSGSGLLPHVKERIYQPFFTTKKAGKGTGLGLSISKGIIESHKGKLWLDDQCTNTRFLIRVPKRQTPYQLKVS